MTGQPLRPNYAHDAVLMPPTGPMVAGPTAISQWVANAGLEVTEFTTNLSSLEGQAELASVRGTCTLVYTVPPATASVTDSGKFLWLVRRGPDGRLASGAARHLLCTR